MPSEAIILTSHDNDPYDINLAKLANFLGVPVTCLKIKESRLSLEYLDRHCQDREPCLLVNTGTLSDVLSQKENALALNTFLESKKACVLFYNISPSSNQSTTLKHLSDGLITSVIEITAPDSPYNISDKHRPVCQQLSGMTVVPAGRPHDFGFALSTTTPDIARLISVGHSQTPLFFRMKKGHSDLFFLANTHCLDLETYQNRRIIIERFFSDVVPATLFLKYVFGDTCWHRPKTQACCTVDDPLLKEPYGYLSYFKLIDVMDELDFFTNIAFIPWNYKRSKPEVTKLLASRPDRFGLSIHGCNHTRGEFMLQDRQALNQLIQLALSRMAVLHQKTGVGFDRIMVFPQAMFSLDALRTLKSNNYQAVASIAAKPRDNSRGVPFSSLLEPAIMDFHSFPIITRRYPSEMASFAFDFLLGKPAIVYLHQEDYRDDGSILVDHIRKIHALHDGIRWTGLSKIARSLYWQKISSEDRIDIKLFGHECVIENDSDSPRTYSITKREESDVPVENLTLNGKHIEYDISRGILGFSVKIPPRSQVELNLSYRNDVPSKESQTNYGKELFIWTRRHLSEFRDVYLSRSQFLRNTFARISYRRMRSKTFKKE